MEPTTLLQLSPGAGVLFTKVTWSGDATLNAFCRGVTQGIPVLTSCDRVSPFISGSHGKNKLLGIIGHEVAEAVEGYNRLLGGKAKKPVVNRRYMDAFYERMGIDEDRLMAQLGVADEHTSICLGRTSKGGGMVFIFTGEKENRSRLNHAWASRLDGRTEPLKGEEPCRFIEDVAVLTALAKADRMVMYYHLCLAAGWPRKMAPKRYPSTIYSGLCTATMEFHNDSIRVADNAIFCAQDPISQDVYILEAPKGKDNTFFPCQWSVTGCPPLPFNRVTIESSAMIDYGAWCTT